MMVYTHTNLDFDMDDIVNVNQKRWKIEEPFRISKTEFKLALHLVFNFNNI